VLRQLIALLTVMCAACSAARSAEPPGPSAGGITRDIDASRDAGWKVWATYPIFHQIVAFSFPKGFVPSYEETKPPSYIQESVLIGETVEKWTQMISVTGLAGAAIIPAITPYSGVEFYASKYRNACPATFSEVRVPADIVAKFSGRIEFLGCGTVGARGEEHSEDMLLIVLKGDQDYYAIQWAERGPASAMPMAYEDQKWSDRLRQLTPFRVCQRLEGEAAPYPSCITPKKQ
jgi:hypothetical protein